jgi:hypothetical protein
MSQADRIRAHVYENNIAPARRNGDESVTIRAGDIHAEMGLANAMPAVCSALRSSKFEDMAGVTALSVTGPQFGANVFFTFALTANSSRPQQKPAPGLQTAGRSIPVQTTDYTDAVFLVSCVSSKQVQPAPARLLYQSDWFVKARAFVEARGGRWFILSALHGVVAPEEVIAPYERTLNTMPVEERRQWAARVHAQLAPLLAGRHRIVFLAGQHYREYLAPALARDGFQIEVPMEGLRIGEQLAWLSGRT